MSFTFNPNAPKLPLLSVKTIVANKPFCDTILKHRFYNNQKSCHSNKTPHESHELHELLLLLAFRFSRFSQNWNLTLFTHTHTHTHTHNFFEKSTT
jgi:hypothetical protein